MVSGEMALADSVSHDWRHRLAAPAAFMFLGFALMAMIAVAPGGRGLGVAAPASRWLSGGGVFSWLSKRLGISALSSGRLAAFYLFALVLLFLSFLWALAIAAKTKKASRPVLVGCAIAFGLVVTFVPPIMAKDLFNYAAYGRMISAYGRNPYLFAPRAFPHEPVVQYISWKGAVSVYGPLFSYISAAATAVVGRSAVSAVVAFKLLALGFYAATVFLTDELARRMRPERRSFIVVAAAWNPLVVLLLVGGGHNDTMMVFLVVLGLLLYHTGRPVWSVISVVLAALVKTTALLFLVPLLVLFLRENARWGLRKYLQAAISVVAVAVAFYAPLWPGARGFFKILSVGSGYSSASVPRFMKDDFTSLLKMSGYSSTSASTFSGIAVKVIFLAAFAVAFLWLSYKVTDFHSLVRNSGLIAFAFIVTATWLMPWYAGFMVVVAALSGSYLIVGATTGATFVMLLLLPGSYQLPRELVPVFLLVTALVLVVGLFFSARRHGELLPGT